MNRLMEKIVFSGFITAWRFATVPTRRSPPSVNATTDGVVRPPSEFSMISGSPPSSTAIAELVVPRSIPIVLAIFRFLLLFQYAQLVRSMLRKLSATIADLWGIRQGSAPAGGGRATPSRRPQQPGGGWKRGRSVVSTGTVGPLSI